MIRFNKRCVFTLLKYLYSFLLILLSYKTTGQLGYIVAGEIELLFILCVSDILLSRHRAFGWLNSIVLLFLNIEYTVLYFSGSFVTYVMLENIDSVQDLSGKAAVYMIGTTACVFFSFLPIEKIPVGMKKMTRTAAVSLLLELCCLVASGSGYSPLQAVYGIYEQWNLHQSFYVDEEWEPEFSYELFHDAGNSMETVEVIDDTEALAEYSTDAAPEYTCNLDRPNVILIFTEGLSENIVTDERNIMPNVAALQDNSINFINYYNHTFATYRGLIGQLYSGHQLDDYDVNNLISIEDIMRDQGYWTTMINTEPNNETFSDYLKNLSFDEVIEDTSNCNGAAKSLSDKEAYELLYDTAVQYNEEKAEPFFMVFYTFGTHTTLDSTDEIYGDGTDRVLNRFYNADYQFGQFLSKFNDSSLAEDTVLIFTADHATFSDEDFRSAFPDYERVCSDVDEIPFMIYCPGEPALQVDAGGRNSLDMAPTVLDYLDISAPNYFLGNSLFEEKSDELSLDTFFFDPAFIMNTDQDVIRTPDSETKEVIYDLIRNYFSIKMQEQSE